MKTNLRPLALIVTLVMGALHPNAFAAPPMEPLRVNVFPGGFNWGIYVAQDKGLFHEAGVDVSVQGTTGSVAQMTDFAQGRCDLVMTAFDNIVAYVEGQGEAPIGPQPEFVAVMGSDNSFLSLVTLPPLKSFDDLRGKTLSVDALTTGYAFVLFDMLRRNGVSRDDYRVDKAGGMTQRWTALQAGQQAGTMLSAPYDILAKAKGMNQIAWATDVLGAYQGNVAAVRRSWAAAHPDAVVAYIAAYVKAIDWLYEPEHKAEAIAILRKNLPQMSAELADQTYQELLDPKTGFFRKGRVDEAGIRTVLELRSRYAEPKKQLGDAGKYLDLQYYQKAMR